MSKFKKNADTPKKDKKATKSLIRLIKRRDKNISSSKKKTTDTKTIKGKIQGHLEGFAFFIPEDKQSEDLFIHPKNLNGAIHGDTVEVTAGVYRGRKEAVVVKILERGIKTFVGVADVIRRKKNVIPLSKNFVTPMRIIEEPCEINDGDVIICSVERYPDDSRFGEAVVTEKLGHITDIGIDNKIVMYKYGLKDSFPREVEAEASRIESGKFNADTSNITDFRDLFTVTIDGESARDYDDAISLGMEEGKTVLYVHIADVSRFVIKGSLLDEEAKVRGTSVYFPQFAIPMLPEALSNGLCSLVPNADRYTVTAKIIFDEAGERVHTSFYRSMIRSDYRLTYNYVNRVLAGEEKSYSDELKAFIDNANKLADLLALRRVGRGGLDFDLPEAEFHFNSDGSIADIRPGERGVAERIIEFFMISANESVADYFSNRNISGVYRVHGTPDVRKLEQWIETAGNFGVALPEIEYPLTPQSVRSLADCAGQSSYSSVLSPALIRCMMRAEYCRENQGHFGLSSEAYTHFTSPIRRYPDLMVHRALLGSLGYEKNIENIEELDFLSGEMSRLERVAADVEYEITSFKKIEYLKSHEDEVYEGYINRISSGGLFIFIDKLILTGFVDFALMSDDRYYVDEGGVEATGYHSGKSYKVGDRVDVRLFTASVILMRADFCLIEDEFQGKKGRRRRR